MVREGRMSVNKTVGPCRLSSFHVLSHRMRRAHASAGPFEDAKGNTDESNKPQHTEYSRRDGSCLNASA